MKCAVLLCLLLPVVFAGTSTVNLKGRLTCPSDPKKAAGVKVKLLDKKFGPDHNMKEEKTDSEGNFQIQGTATNIIGDGDIRFRIYHNCLDMWPGYARKWDFEVPDQWKNGQLVDVGTWNLEIKIDQEEEKDLIH